MKNTALSLLTLLALAGSLSAGPFAPRAIPGPNVIIPSSLFRDSEFFFDLYGSYLDRTSDNICGCDSGSSGNHGWGGGIAAGRYITPNLALRADATFSSLHDSGTQIGADVLLRFPIERAHLAPYALVGGGIETENGTNGFLRVGGGLEWRVTRSIGIFSEASYSWVYNDEHSNNLTIKLGMRFVY